MGLVARRGGPPHAENLHSIPYPNFLCGLSDTALKQAMETVERSNRSLLVSAMWGHHGGAEASAVRQGVAQMCMQHRSCNYTCITHCVGPDMKKEIITEEIVKTKVNSVFCLEPEGDTPSRKGLVDSIVLGCIPVLFSARQARLWPWHG